MSFSDHKLHKSIDRGINAHMQEMNKMHTTSPVLSNTKSQGVSFSANEVSFWTHVLHLSYLKMETLLHTGKCPVTSQKKEKSARRLSESERLSAQRVSYVIVKEFLPWAKLVCSGRCTEADMKEKERLFLAFVNNLTTPLPSSLKQQYDKFKVWSCNAAHNVAEQVVKDLDNKKKKRKINKE
jgi:hypothetical protein